MASCQTSRWVSTAPYARLTLTQGTATATTIPFTWKLEYIADYAADAAPLRPYSVSIGGVSQKTGTFSINGKTGTHTVATGTYTATKGTTAKSIAFSFSFAFNLTWSGVYKGTLSASGSVSIPAKTSYTVSYNANGGSGAPSSQTKWYGTALTLSSTKPTRTGYAFQGWATSASGSVAYAAGASYTANAAVTLYAVWKANTYIVSYNANGGSGAPSSQTKTYGKALTLSSTKPTRTNYTFKGWGTSASATSVAYAAGASYTANAAVTLYAVWELAYVKPVIYNLTASRCDSAGTVSDTGNCGLISFDWKTTNTVSSITIAWNSEAGGSGTKNVTASGKSGSVSVVIGDNALSTDATYTVLVVVADSTDSNDSTATLNGALFPWDAKSGGDGLGIGKPAELGAAQSLGGTGVADFAFDAKFNEPVYGNVLGLNRLPEIPENSDFNDYMETGSYAVYKNATAETIANMPVQRAGRLEVSSATGEGIRLEEWSYLRQKFIPYNIDNAVWERDITRDSSNVWHYYDWVRTSLSKAASERVYREAKVLWSGGYYMTAAHTAALSEAISAQNNGIVLVFSAYSDGAVGNYWWHDFFIPKHTIANHPGTGHCFTMAAGNFSLVAMKYLMISDTLITGHNNNSLTGNSASGITFTNNRFVLRYVLGV